MIKKLSILLVFSGLIWWSCEEKIPPHSIPPLSITVTSLSVGDTILTETLYITLDSDDRASGYRYRLDASLWSDWSTSDSILLDYLDEGSHELYVQAVESGSNDTSEVVSISFVVDAVEGPSLMFYPRRHKAQVGETVTFFVNAEEVENLMAAELHMEFDSTALSVVSVGQGSFFMNGQETIFSYELGQDNIDVLTSVVNSDAPAVNGTGPLMELQVTLLGSAAATISFSGNEVFRDPDNNDFVILEEVNGLVTEE